MQSGAQALARQAVLYGAPQQALMIAEASALVAAQQAAAGVACQGWLSELGTSAS